MYEELRVLVMGSRVRHLGYELGWGTLAWWAIKECLFDQDMERYCNSAPWPGPSDLKGAFFFF